MSLIESVNEKPIISKPFIVRAIVPLISIFGYIYATIKTLYFQQFYTIATEPVKKIEIDSIVRIYRRRFELKNIGLEIFVDK